MYGFFIWLGSALTCYAWFIESFATLSQGCPLTHLPPRNWQAKGVCTGLLITINVSKYLTRRKFDKYSVDNTCTCVVVSLPYCTCTVYKLYTVLAKDKGKYENT